MAEEQPTYDPSGIDALRTKYEEMAAGKREVQFVTRVQPVTHQHDHLHWFGRHSHPHAHTAGSGYPRTHAHIHEHEESLADSTAGCVHEDAVKWNPWNRVVQCHRCGQVFVPEDATSRECIDLGFGEKVTVRVAGGEIQVMNLRGGGGVTMVEKDGVRVEYLAIAAAGVNPTHVYHDLGFRLGGEERDMSHDHEAERGAVPPHNDAPLTRNEHEKLGHLHYWSIQYTNSSGSRVVNHRQSLDEVALFVKDALQGVFAGVPTEQSALTISSHWYAPEPLPAE